MFNLWLHLTFLYIEVSRPGQNEKEEVYPYDSEQASKCCHSTLEILKENDQVVSKDWNRYVLRIKSICTPLHAEKRKIEGFCFL